MANALLWTLLFLLTPLSWAPSPALAHYARIASRTPSDIAKKALPTVVNVNCTRTPTPADKHSVGVGSGVILREDGLIVTSYHVIEGAEKITVTLQGKTDPLKARVLAVDSRSDIALIRLDQPPPRLPTLKLGDSDRLQVGDLAIAVGNPFGFSHTVTLGIVSARGRNGAFMGPYGDQGPEVDDMIQTDAAINPGNSGGPLLNSDGEMIGLNAAIFSQNGAFIGIGFAIPSKVVREITDQLLRNGRVIRGWLGITAQSLDGRLARRFHSEPLGALISDIRAHGPAFEAGLKPGDIIKSFDRQPVADSSVLRNLTAKAASGKTVDVEYLRDSKLGVAKVRIREQPSAGVEGNSDGGVAGLPAKVADKPKSPRNASELGLAMQNVPSDLRSMMGLDSKQGVLVGQVTPGSPAAEAGLSSGDVLLIIEGEAISTMDEASSRISRWLKGRKTDEDSLLVLVQRGPGDRVYMAVPVN